MLQRLTRSAPFAMAICLLVVAIVQVVFLFQQTNLTFVPRVAVDSLTYQKIALNLATGHGFSVIPDNPTAWREPGYPAFLSVLYRVADKDSYLIGIVHIALLLLTCLVALKITSLLYGPSAGLIAATLTGLSPSIANINTYLLSETLYIPLLGLGLLTLIGAAQRPTSARFLMAGLVLGAAALVREVTLLIVLTVFLTWCVLFRHKLMFVARSCVAVGLIISALVIPWLVRNYQTFGVVTPLHVHAGFGLYLAYHPQFDFYTDYPDNEPGPLDFVSEFDTNDGRGGLQYQQTLLNAAMANIKAHPALAFRQAIVHVMTTWSPTPETIDAAMGSSALYHLLRLYYVFILLLAVIGAAFQRASAGPWRWILVVVVLVYPTVSAVLSGGHHRYVVPVTPFILMFSAAGALWITQQIKALWQVRNSSKGVTTA